MPIEPGARIGAYEVQEFVGRGAMGVVYRAYHSGLARPAAIKALQALAPDPDASARFRREAQSIAQMRHPNILNVFDFGEYEGVPYMIVEFVPGGSLGDRLKHGEPLGRVDVVRLLRGIGSGLDYAHSLGVVHRDVKPANVLLGRDDTPILADFGLAKLLQSSSVQSATGVTTGTPAYMSPEQVTGRAVGPAADRYALATVAYELLAGCLPFEGLGVLELLYAHVHREPPPPSEARPELGPAADAVLLRGLAKDPAGRWESCAVMVEALDRALTGAPERAPEVAATTPLENLAPPATPAAQAQTGRRRLWPWAAVAGLALVLLAAGVAGLLAARSPAGANVSLSDSTVAAGGSVVLHAVGLPAGQTGDIELESPRHTIAAFRADTSGDLDQDVRIPPATSPGDHRLLVCWSGACHGGAAVRVTR